jgi:hypothetical protein
MNKLKHIKCIILFGLLIVTTNLTLIKAEEWFPDGTHRVKVNFNSSWFFSRDDKEGYNQTSILQGNKLASSSLALFSLDNATQASLETR